MHAALHCLAVFVVLALARGALLAQAAASIPFLAPKQLRIDGALSDWSFASWQRVGDDPKGRAEVALAYDDSSLFIAARVFDDAFVRSPQPGPSEDALVLALELPGARARSVELWLYAGQIGRTRAVAQLRDRARASEPPAVRVVEGPGARGEAYVLEASCPWSSLSEATPMFARAQWRLNDADGRGKPRVVLGSAAAELAFERGPLPALSAFLRDRDLAAAPKLLDAVTEVRGAGMARVVAVGTSLVLAYASGKLAFVQLPATHAADVRSAQLLDLTGDGASEVALRLVTRDSSAQRELWLVFDLSVSAPRQRFGVELARERGGASVRATLDVAKPAPNERAPRIVLRAAEGKGVAAGQDFGPGLNDIVPVPIPGSWAERTYAWDGAAFALRGERPAHPQPMATAPRGAAPDPPAPELPPAAVSGSDSAQLIEAYRAARDMSKSIQPRFAQRANVAEDARPEQLALYERECLVVGPGFRDGKDFFYFALPVQSADQVLALFTGDVTGDRRHEILARIAAPQGAATRALLFVYSFHSGHFETLLTAEVGRVAAGQAIQNEVRVVPHQGKTALQIRPGAARGWTEASYPYGPDAQPGIAPLLLPWSDRDQHYCYASRQLVRCLGSD